eukprot:1810070-Prymnesium_polylepis.1
MSDALPRCRHDAEHDERGRHARQAAAEKSSRGGPGQRGGVTVNTFKCNTTGHAGRRGAPSGQAG